MHGELLKDTIYQNKLIKREGHKDAKREIPEVQVYSASGHQNPA